MNLKDKILSVARLEDVVERYLPLKETGYSKKTRVGLCPFHADRHPSLHVNVKEQYYKCFACGEGGDLFTFVQKMEGCDFREALKKLAGWYGLSDTDDWQPVKYPPIRKKQPVKPIELANPIYVDSLLRNHRMVLGLLEEYVPDNEILRETYKAFEVGIASSFLPSDYKDFCNRLIFPIRNEQGDLVAFAGRYRGDAEGKDIRKYVNSPDRARFTIRATFCMACIRRRKQSGNINSSISPKDTKMCWPCMRRGSAIRLRYAVRH